MKKLTVAVFAILSAVTSLAQTPTTTNTAAKPSPAEQTMAVAQKQIDKNPKNFEAYNALALAQSRRARETSNVRFYNDAETLCRSPSPSRPATSTANAFTCGCCWASMNLRPRWSKPTNSTSACPRRDGLWLPHRRQRGTRQLQGSRSRLPACSSCAPATCPPLPVRLICESCSATPMARSSS